MSIKTLVTLGTALAFGTLSYAAFSADQNPPAKAQAPAASTAKPAASTAQAPADKGTSQKSASHKKSHSKPKQPTDSKG